MRGLIFEARIINKIYPFEGDTELILIDGDNKRLKLLVDDLSLSLKSAYLNKVEYYVQHLIQYPDKLPPFHLQYHMNVVEELTFYEFQCSLDNVELYEYSRLFSELRDIHTKQMLKVGHQLKFGIEILNKIRSINDIIFQRYKRLFESGKIFTMGELVEYEDEKK